MAGPTVIDIVTRRVPLVTVYKDEAARIAAEYGVAVDGLELVRKGLTADDLRVEESERAVVMSITTDAIDRDGEVMLPKGAVLKDFKKNPVVQWVHDYDKPPVGTAAWIKPTEHGIASKVVYARRPATLPEAVEWFPDTLLDLNRQNVLRGASIGFVPLKSHAPTPKEIRANPDWAEIHRVHDKWLLLEFSLVPIPSNPDALVLAKTVNDPDAAENAPGSATADAGAEVVASDTLETSDAATVTPGALDAKSPSDSAVTTPGLDETEEWLAAHPDVSPRFGLWLRKVEHEAAVHAERLDAIEAHLAEPTVRVLAPVAKPPPPVYQIDPAALAAAINQSVERALGNVRTLPQDRIDRARGVVVIEPPQEH